MIYIRLDIGRKEVTREVKLAVHVPFSVYLGWITVATVANITALLVSLGLVDNGVFFGLDESIWTAIVLLVATTISVVLVITRKDVAYGLVPVWAFIGIAVKQLESRAEVSIVAAVFTLVIIAAIAWTVIKDRMN